MFSNTPEVPTCTSEPCLNDVVTVVVEVAVAIRIGRLFVITSGQREQRSEEKACCTGHDCVLRCLDRSLILVQLNELALILDFGFINEKKIA